VEPATAPAGGGDVAPGREEDDDGFGDEDELSEEPDDADGPAAGEDAP
jgi:hypothetical protein